MPMLYPYAAGPVCDCEFNFTLSEIDSSEFTQQAKLLLYLQIFHFNSPSYIVKIRTKGSNGILSELTSLKEINATKDGYVEFDVTALVTPLISRGGKYD